MILGSEIIYAPGKNDAIFLIQHGLYIPYAWKNVKQI